jgi:HEAT repeat protein
MPLLIFIILIIAAAVWWSRSNKSLTANERQYLKRRGYAVDDAFEIRQPVDNRSRLTTTLESLSDLSPFARQRAAQDLAQMCEQGQGDALMLYPLLEALDDSDASVRSAVASALGKLGDARAIEALKKRLATEESIQPLSFMRKALQVLEETKQ